VSQEHAIGLESGQTLGDSGPEEKPTKKNATYLKDHTRDYKRKGAPEEKVAFETQMGRDNRTTNSKEGTPKKRTSQKGRKRSLSNNKKLRGRIKSQLRSKTHSGNAVVMY